MCKMFTMCVIIILSKKMHVVCVCGGGGRGVAGHRDTG